jgi:hypothetical protein
VRFLNNLLICNPTCVSFNGLLTASQGYQWTSVSGTYSPYQPVTTPTLSNFTLTALGFGASLSFAGSFPITPGRNDALIVTLDASNNPLLVLQDEGSVSGAVAPGTPPPALTLSSQPGAAGGIRFAPASPAPAAP